MLGAVRRGVVPGCRAQQPANSPALREKRHTLAKLSDSTISCWSAPVLEMLTSHSYAPAVEMALGAGEDIVGRMEPVDELAE